MNRPAFPVRRSPCGTACALLAAALLAILPTGCGKGTVRPDIVAPGFSPAQLRSSTLWITVDTVVTVKGMEKAFVETFGSGGGLSAFLGSALRDSLARGIPEFDAQWMPGETDPADTETAAWPGPAGEGRAERVPGLPMDLPEDDVAESGHAPGGAHLSGYIVRVTNLRIARTTRTLPVSNLPSGMQPGVEPAGGGTSEGCEATFDLEIRDNASGALRARYHVTGQADVPLHAYQVALREAVQATVRAGTRLLRTD